MGIKKQGMYSNRMMARPVSQGFLNFFKPLEMTRRGVSSARIMRAGRVTNLRRAEIRTRQGDERLGSSKIGNLHLFNPGRRITCPGPTSHLFRRHGVRFRLVDQVQTVGSMDGAVRGAVKTTFCPSMQTLLLGLLNLDADGPWTASQPARGLRHQRLMGVDC